MDNDEILKILENNASNYLPYNEQEFGSHKFIKKIIKKLMMWLLAPMLERQNIFNGYTVSLLKLVEQNADEERKRLTSIEQTNERLNRFIYDNACELREEIKKMEIQLINQENLFTELQDNQNNINNLCGEHSRMIGLYDQKLALVGDLLKYQDNFWRKTSVSQTGEDVIIAYILKVLNIDLTNVTYLDLGANHAKDLSNTYYFYEHGSRGVLVEANPALIPELKLFRSEDIIVNKCISETNGEKLCFYVLNGDGLSTCDKKSVENALAKNPTLRVEQVVEIESITIQSLMEKYFVEAPTILNIDIEGMEFEVVKALDLNKHRPLLIICEMIPYKTSLVVGEKNEELKLYMEQHQYSEFAFTGINSIFIDNLKI